MIYGIATIHVNPGMQADYIAGAKKLVAATVKEEGCISYDLHQSITDPECFVFVERWTTREALARHMETPHIKEFRAVAPKFVAKRKFEIIEPGKVDTV